MVNVADLRLLITNNFLSKHQHGFTQGRLVDSILRLNITKTVYFWDSFGRNLEVAVDEDLVFNCNTQKNAQSQVDSLTYKSRIDLQFEQELLSFDNKTCSSLPSHQNQIPCKCESSSYYVWEDNWIEYLMVFCFYLLCLISVLDWMLTSFADYNL
jgi:hypothetical protein